MTERYVHTTPRLTACMDLLHGTQCVADIGCDHGRLTVALLQQGICRHVVATDVSGPSLKKAERLASITGLSSSISFRSGDGFSVLQARECDAAALLGMGGTLMARLLEAADAELLSDLRLVLQPMRAFSDIRRYLHLHCWHITDDRVIREGRRCYQVFSAVQRDAPQQIPVGWPDSFYDLGFVALQNGDRNLTLLAKTMLQEVRKRLRTAAGTTGEENLRKKECALKWICAQGGIESETD